MPVDLDLLNEPINRCLVAWPERQLGDVLMELVFREGEDWWHLVVDLGEGHFASIQFNKLTSLAESDGLEFFQRALSSLVASVIPDVLVVEQSAIGTQAAKDLADESPGRVLVVTQDGGFFRILYRGEAGGGPAGPSLLDLFLPHADAFRPQEAAIEPPPDGTPPELPPDEAPPDEVHPAEQPRYIQARVADPGALIPYLPLGAPLFSDHSYRLLVRIGLPDTDWLSPHPKQVFPEDELFKSVAIHRLQVAFFEPNHAPEPQLQTLLLNKRGSSEPVRFTFHTLPDQADFEARIVVLYENRILQTALLRSRVLTSDRPALAGGETGLHLAIEALVRTNLRHLENMPQTDASLVLNHTPTGEPGMQAYGGDQPLVISLGGVQPLINAIKHELGAIYRSPERFEDGLWGEASQALLFRLAVSGSLLYTSLLRDQALADHPLFTCDRLQVVTTNVASFLPLEYIYDRQTPSLGPPHAPLCPREKAEPCLQSGTCLCEVADQRQVVCPLGFWGLRKAIERFAFERPPDGQPLVGDVFRVSAGVNGVRAELQPKHLQLGAGQVEMPQAVEYQQCGRCIRTASPQSAAHGQALVEAVGVAEVRVPDEVPVHVGPGGVDAVPRLGGEAVELIPLLPQEIPGLLRLLGPGITGQVQEEPAGVLEVLADGNDAPQRKAEA